MREEKDHFEAVLQEERERKQLAESNLAKEQLKMQEISVKEKAWQSAQQGMYFECDMKEIDQTLPRIFPVGAFNVLVYMREYPCKRDFNKTKS